MFIIKKNISGHEYFYVRESVRDRESGKVKAKTVCYGGKTREDAERKLKDLNFERSVKTNKSTEDETKKMASGKIEEQNEQETEGNKKILTIDELSQFCKTKGFIFRSSDIYGGLAGFWDFGPLGVELFNNLKQDWWNFFVRKRENMVGIEASIISHPRTWKASGHIANFNINDYLVVCTKCKKSNKIDKPDLGKIKCDSCGGDYDWGNAKMIEQMFKTRIGTDSTEAYLRGETAQGMFMDFKLAQQTSRMQLPFGIAQIGRCFRNEIAPRDFLFRSREFHIGEFEFFINPEEKKCDVLNNEQLNVKFKLLDAETQIKGKEELKEVTIKEILEENKLEEWHAYWLAEQIRWLRSIGLIEIKIREHRKDELSHYSSATFDMDYSYPFGSKEIAGNANRGQYDLTQHQKESGESMEIFDEKYRKKVIAKVIEPTFGMERVFLAVLTKAYTFDEKRGYIVLKIPAKLAPVKAAVFPIIKKPEYEELAKKIVDELREEFNVTYDKSGSIGKRYARNDEIGTPMCITIDEESEKTKAVTIRWRDTADQVKIEIKNLKDVIRRVINGENLLSFGKLVNTRKKD